MTTKVVTTSFSFGKEVTSAKELLESKGYKILNHSTNDVKALDEEELLRVLKEADALLCGVDPVTARVIESANSLKVISRFGVGYDTVDLLAANKKKIYVTNTPGVLSKSVADYTFSLLVSLARKIPYIDRVTKKGMWQGIISSDIHGKTLGIIGFGEIGSEVAKRATGFNMKIIYTDVHNIENDFTQRYNIRRVELKDLLSKADFISINCSLSAHTRGMLDSSKLDLIKSTAFLINTSRGGIIDEDQLFKKLRAKEIAGAALDVFDQEPPNVERFKDLDNFIASTHSGAFTLETINQMGDMAAQNIIDVLEGREPKYWVNRNFSIKLR